MTFTLPDNASMAEETQNQRRHRKGQQEEAFSAEEMGVQGGELRQFIERVERLEEEKAALNDDIKDVLAEAKGRGFNVKAFCAIIRLRKQDPEELELYMNALGMA